MDRRCPSRTASFPIPGSTSAKEAWHLDARGEWDSAPVIDTSGVVYIHDTARGVVAIAHDGSELWATPLEGQFAPSLAIGTDGTVYVWNGALSALQRDGTPSWTVSPASNPADVPIAMGGDGTVRVLGSPPSAVPPLYAGDSTGATVLEVALLQSGAVQSPLTMGPDGSMYVLVASRLLAMTPGGQPVWSAPLGPVDGTVVISVGVDGTIYVPAGQGNPSGVTAFTAAGTRRWTTTLTDGPTNQLAVADDGSSFVATGGGLFELNPDGSTAWFYESDGPEGAVIADGTSAGYAPFINYPPGTTTANVVRFAASGAATWAIPVNGVPLALGADGTVYAGVVSGTSLSPQTVYTSLLAIAR
jgi:WD40 repeat protein